MKGKINILLISPIAGIHDFLYKNIPLPLLAICRNIDLEKYNIIIIDQKFSGWKKRLKYVLKKRKILLAGITALTGYQLKFGILIAGYIRKHRPDIKIVFGGIHPTSTPEICLKEDYIDYIVLGEAEEIFPRLVECLAKNKNPVGIKGIGYKDKNKKIIINEEKEFINLDNLADLPYNLINMKRYISHIGRREFYIEGARGCPYNCSFCYNTIYNRRIRRAISPEKIISNMKHLLLNYGIDNFFIIDDSFFVSKKRVFKFCRLIKENRLAINWSCEANYCSIKSLDNDVIKELISSGMSWIAVGVESGSEGIRRKLNKHIDNSELIEFNRKISKYNLKIRYNFMTGIAFEEEEDLHKTITLIKILLSDNPNAMIQPIYITVPFPKTRYFDQCKKYGLKVPKTLAEWSKYDSYRAREFLPWISGKKGDVSEFLMYISYFIDLKIEHHISDSAIGKVLKLICKVYNPFARFRFNNFYYSFFFEKWLIKEINKMQLSAIENKLI
ncbi:B12-binding domain-containing radical SAM protein [Candidatus Woesearchaeota archaeon]|nr:B12-binding domain-containing radical SAM protein [Candidatus Woesearchaeota archaeon]